MRPADRFGRVPQSYWGRKSQKRDDWHESDRDCSRQNFSSDDTTSKTITPASFRSAMKIRQHPAEYESIKPGRGSLPARAWNVHSNSQKLSLNGDWRFRYSPIAAIPDEFAISQSYDDSQWAHIPVLSTWVLHGYGALAYQNIKFPFPVDPPRVPTENPTGDYRCDLKLPDGWSFGSGKVGEMNSNHAYLLDYTSF